MRTTPDVCKWPSVSLRIELIPEGERPLRLGRPGFSLDWWGSHPPKKSHNLARQPFFAGGEVVGFS